MDGIAIYQGVCAIFIVSCYGIQLTLPQMLTSVGLPVDGIALVAGEGELDITVPVRRGYTGKGKISARPEQLFFSESGMPGTILFSTFLGDFIEYEVQLGKRNYMMSSLRPPQETQLHGWKRFLVSLPIYIVVGLAFLPQIVVVCQSFVERSFSGMVKGINLNNYRAILSRLGRNIRNTYVFSIVAIVFILTVTTIISLVIVFRLTKGKVKIV